MNLVAAIFKTFDEKWHGILRISFQFLVLTFAPDCIWPPTLLPLLPYTHSEPFLNSYHSSIYGQRPSQSHFQRPSRTEMQGIRSWGHSLSFRGIMWLFPIVLRRPINGTSHLGVPLFWRILPIFAHRPHLFPEGYPGLEFWFSVGIYVNKESSTWFCAKGEPGLCFPHMYRGTLAAQCKPASMGVPVLQREVVPSSGSETLRCLRKQPWVSDTWLEEAHWGSQHSGQEAHTCSLQKI